MKNKNYKLRSKVYKGIGNLTLGATTLGGFFGYEMLVDWENFNTEIKNFIVVQENSLKLNLMIAFPLLVSLIVTLWVMIKKNKEFFKDKISMNLLIIIIILYMFYSIVEVAMFSLMGAFAGSLFDEFIFSPLSKGAKLKGQDQKELDDEYKKEKRRIEARKKASEEIDGSV